MCAASIRTTVPPGVPRPGGVSDGLDDDVVGCQGSELGGLASIHRWSRGVAGEFWRGGGGGAWA